MTSRTRANTTSPSNGLLHELSRRKIVADDYTGTTLRENLGLPVPGRLRAAVAS